MGWWWICLCSIGLSSASPLYTRQTSTSNSHSAKIIAPVVIVAVVCFMLVALGWWKRRKRTQELIQQLQTPATTETATANNTATNAQTTPSTGADAPARPPRRRRRRRPSQISTKSLPAYNEQAGDEEIVLVRRAERQSESDDDSNENDNDHAPTQATSSRAPDSRPLLDDDSSPDMPRVSLASSTRNQSLNDQPQQSQLGHESIANTTTSIADTEEPSAVPQPHEVPSYTEAMSTSHVNLPTETEHSAQPSTDHSAQPSTSTDHGPPPADADATVRPKRKSVFRHLGRFNITKPSTNEAMEMTHSRTSTSTPRPSISISGHRPSGSGSTHRPSTSLSAHGPSPSLSSLSLVLTRTQSPSMSRTSLNISAPIPTTLVRTELSYPRAGPTPEQIRFLSSRESLGRFGMPYGEQAIAAAKSREYLPPVYKPRVDPGASTSGNGDGASTAQEDEPTVTIRQPLLTAGERAQKSANPSGPTDDRDLTMALAGQGPVDPAMTVREEGVQDPADSKVIQDSPIQEEPESMNPDVQLRLADGNSTEQHNGDVPKGNRVQEPNGVHELNGDVGPNGIVEPRARESPPDDPRDNRRESVFTTRSFVTATEGQGDSSPPTPTAETYQPHQPTPSPHQTGTQSQDLADTQSQAPVRGQTVLIPESRDALHPELTLVPATPITWSE